MPKRLSVSVLVEVPDDPFAAADIYKQLQPSWQSLLEALKASGTQYDLKMSEMEVRAKRAPRGKNKPKPTPTLVTPPTTGEAA